MTLRWLLLTTVLTTVHSTPYLEQRFAIEPQNQTVIVGSRVTLPCRVINKSGVLQWTKNGFGLGSHRNLTGFDRYRMIGSDEEGDYSLEMNPVLLEDDARYQCQVGWGTEGQPGISSQFATITVLVPPKHPKIIQGESLVTMEDRETELECVSLGGKSAAEITWIDGYGNVLTQNIENIVEKLSDSTFTTKSILKLRPKKYHHNTTFTCQAQNAADRTYKTAKLRLEVNYAPKVKVEILYRMNQSRLIPEGADITLACQADANPPDVSYEWFVNNELVEGEFTAKLILRNVTRKLQDADVKCNVKNLIGESKDFETLEISYGPSFRSRPESIQADLGSTVTLICDVDGNPPPEIMWIHENTDKVVGTSANLTLTVSNNSGGRYHCKASITGYPEVMAEGAIYIKGRPTIISHRTQFGIIDDLVTVECVAFSIPRPNHIFWSFGGVEIDSTNEKYFIVEHPLPNGIESTLIIPKLESQHYGVYNCSVTNPYGTDWAEILLKAQNSFPLVTLLCVVPLVVIVVDIALVLILCQKKVKKPSISTNSNGKEKTLKESDRSSNISDLKLELRTRTSVSNVHCELGYGPDSETRSESVVTRIGVPLAGPVPIGTLRSLSHTSTLPHTGSIPQANDGDRLYRYSAEFPDFVFPPKDGQNNNGYVPYVDYARDYNPPALEGSRGSVLTNSQPGMRLSSVPSGVDRRY